MASWLELREELDHWGQAGLQATFWWRDDDAVDDTPQLDLLLRHAGPVPLALAVIPKLATGRLARKLSKHDSVVVLQHGWRHVNHAPSGYNEYPASRTLEEVSQELASGRRLLTALFGRQTIPVFSPPWHGFDSCFLPLLRPNGITGLSRKGPRPAAFAAEGLFVTNAHIAPIKWTDPPSFEGDDLYLDQVIDHLRGRRDGLYDAAEPTGLLTHHLAQNVESFAFISQFIEIVSKHPSATWVDARNVFARHAAPA
jgi:hypothetical protein